MTWQPIETAPHATTVIVGDFSVENTAIAHNRGRWFLGRSDARWKEDLDFEPRWWLPADYPSNPFKAPFGD